jgi:hypothetical protein
MSAAKKPVTKNKPFTAGEKFLDMIKSWFHRLILRAKAFLARRPHRSFRRTRRRDYKRSLILPGYFAFTKEVRKTLWAHRKLFGIMMIIYVIITGTLVGIASQDAFNTLNDTLKDTGSELLNGNFGQVGGAALLFFAATTGAISQPLQDTQQIYATLVGLMTWLTTVWLLRNVMAGHKVKLRDGLYSSGAPILPTFIIVIVVLLQLIPAALAAIGYAAASSTGLLNGGVEAMLFWIAAGLLVALSLYWVTSTLIALVIVTLPGMYPMKALKIAGDMVVGRRIRILLRLLWMLLGVVVLWAVIMIPIIILDTWLKSVITQLQNIPTIPVLLLLLGSFSVVWIASYVYLLYRKVVDDDAKPA